MLSIALLSLAAIAAPPADFRPTERLIFVASGTNEDCAIVDGAVQMAISDLRIQVPLRRIDKHHLAIDLAALVKDKPRPGHPWPPRLQQLLNTWEKFALDEPHFLGKKIQNPDGRTIRREPNVHLDPNLFDIHLTNVPLVESRWFLKRLLTTIGGGLYYEFRDMPPTHDDALRKFAGTTEKDIADTTQSDAKSATPFSKVTGKPRAVIVIRGTGGHVQTNEGLAMISEDYGDDDLAAVQDPFRTLIDGKRKATEDIYELPNGFHAFGLFDGNGKRQNEAPPDVVKDHEIPAPFTARLNGALACIRCHGPEFGIKPAPNKILKLKLQVFGDLGRRKSDDVERLYGLFSGEFTDVFAHARANYNKAFAALFARYGLRGDAATYAARLAKIIEDYDYSLVDHDKAVAEIGQLLGRDFPVGAQLINLLEPNPPDEFGISPEDPYIGLLTAVDANGLPDPEPITRAKFEQILPDLIRRVYLRKE